MIQAEKRTKSESMTQRETFDEYYSKKLEALVIELKAVIKCGIPFATNAVYACTRCHGRIKVYSDEKLYCLRCDAPKVWPRDLQRCVAQILRSYPCYEGSMQEWEALQSVSARLPLPTEQPDKYGDVGLGKRIRAGREKMGLTREELADLIYKTDGTNISRASIRGYEIANSKPSKHVLAQLEQLLDLEGERA